MKKRNIDYDSFTTEQIFRFAEMGMLQIYEDIFNKKQSVFQAYLCDVIGWDLEVAEYVMKHMEQIESTAIQCWFSYLYINGLELRKISRRIGASLSQYKRKAMPKVTLNSFYTTFKLNKDTAVIYTNIIKLLNKFKKYINFNQTIYERLSVDILSVLTDDKNKPQHLSFRGVTEIPNIIPGVVADDVQTELQQEEIFTSTEQLHEEETTANEPEINWLE